jgi:hypothetical protein
MPILTGRGQGGRGIFGLGGVPGAPTFANNPGVEGNISIPVTFIAPAFNGRTHYNWL